jgi:ribosome-binding factor A
MSRRTEMLASVIHRELMTIIQRELSDPRLVGMPSITRVKVSDDLAFADVYVTIMGTPGQRSASLNALKHSAGLMRTKLTKSLTLRVAPFIRFQLDHDLVKEMEVLDLLRKAAEETEEFERRRAEAAGETVDPSATPPRSGRIPESQIPEPQIPEPQETPNPTPEPQPPA